MMTMRTRVGIAELKAHLSEYVKRARAGERIVVYDRETPVAELREATESGEPLAIQRPTRPWAEVAAELEMGPSIKGVDGVALLREDRNRR
jgi:prevent-host-death family protein